MKSAELLFLLLVTGVFSEIRSQINKPHILFFLADDLGFRDVGYNGATEIETPNIDTLANDGVILDSYYVQPLCTPTRASLLTGKYPIHLGMQHHTIETTQPEGLPLAEDTLPEKLKTVGYKTHMVGKWHLGFYKDDYTPTNRGFDSFYGFYAGSETYYTHKTSGGCGASCSSNILDFRDNSNAETGVDGVYSTFALVDKVETIVNDHHANYPNDPIFLYVSFQNVHSPLAAPDEYVDKYDPDIADTDRRTYAGMVDIMDEAIGNITQFFKDNNMWSDTLTIFSSDNGGTSNDQGYNTPLRGEKSDLWEGGVRGLCFVRGRWLGDTEGTRSDKLFHVSDWYPTLLGTAGITGLTGLDGHDIWGALRTVATASPRTEVLINIDEPQGNDPWTPRHSGAAIRIGDLKLVDRVKQNGWHIPPEEPNAGFTGSSTGRVSEALFKVDTDKEETTDVIGENQYVTQLQELRDRLVYFRGNMLTAQDAANDPDARTQAETDNVWGPWQP